MFFLKETKGKREENCKLYISKKYGLFHGRSNNHTNYPCTISIHLANTVLILFQECQQFLPFFNCLVHASLMLAQYNSGEDAEGSYIVKRKESAP